MAAGDPQSGVRAVVALGVLLASATALAKPRVQVAPFSVHSEGLAYFGPEVGRAVIAALEGDGVETGAGAAETIVGRIDELPGERVRLSATLRGRTLTAEGPLEAIDAVATQLANKMAPLLLENDPAAQRLAEKRARDAEQRAASVPPSRPALRAARAEPPKPPATQPPKAPATHAQAPKAEPKPPAEKPAPPVEESEVDPSAEPKAEPEAKSESASEPKAEAPKTPEWVPPRVDGPPTRGEPPPRVEPPAAAPPPPGYYGGFVRGRVVAHAVSDAHPVYAAAGVMATQALFSFLQRRLRVTVIPTGVGITSPALASDEAYRAAARAVVMARLDSVEFVPGPAARVRLEVVVVRDGRPVMRRVVDSGPTEPSRRGADPVYRAVTMALEAMVPELVGALADVR